MNPDCRVSVGLLVVLTMIAACSPRPSPRAADATVPPTPQQAADEPGADATAAANPSEACDDAAERAAAARPRPARDRPFVNVIPSEDVPLTRTMPTREVKLGSVSCKAGHEVWYDAERRVRVCTVARRVTLHGIEIAGDAYTHFHDDGRPYQTDIAKPTVLKTAAGAEIACDADLVVLSKSGALEHCKLVRTLSVGRVACRGGESIAFHPQGELAGAVLDRALDDLGATFPPGTRLHWYPSGKLAGGWLTEPLTVAGVPLRYQFSLHENGRLRVFTLGGAHTFQGHELPERAEVELRKDGSLKRAEFEVDRGFMPHGEPWTDTKHVAYDCAGKVVHASVEHWQAESSPRRFRER